MNGEQVEYSLVIPSGLPASNKAVLRKAGPIVLVGLGILLVSTVFE